MGKLTYVDRNYDLGWIMGFIEGEGCFAMGFIVHKRESKNIHRTWHIGVSPKLTIRLSSDDLIALKNIRDILSKYDIHARVAVKNFRLSKITKTGKIEDKQSLLEITNLENCCRLSKLFGNLRFYSNKKDDFKIWRELVDFIYKRRQKGYRKPWTKSEIINFAKIYEKLNDRRKRYKKYTVEFFRKLDIPDNDKKIDERMWKDEEIDFLKNNYKYYTRKELGEKLGKSMKSISKKMWLLNLKSGNYPYWQNKHLTKTMKDKIGKTLKDKNKLKKMGYR